MRRSNSFIWTARAAAVGALASIAIGTGGFSWPSAGGLFVVAGMGLIGAAIWGISMATVAAVLQATRKKGLTVCAVLIPVVTLAVNAPLIIFFLPLVAWDPPLEGAPLALCQTVFAFSSFTVLASVLGGLFRGLVGLIQAETRLYGR